ncbi:MULTISPECIES: carbohydrate ABC transporter permease [Protofrankia]|uniref:Glycerol-3-phosphate ABC transporter permease n=1 Tax=Protofrankia coriariae TaxID=1562887 RepID=A0ABR5F0S3_9ACTN|nr:MULTISPECIES: sugar ABC transporter permease [Protofrankia]KLL10315.1 glycerol-3-phosphate ABC transporter permease [Protofrankia coriariae]ONH34515.1 glycerol-3-phosphate ABC transporter permease [Protofrankia sp. BMG5.30]
MFVEVAVPTAATGTAIPAGTAGAALVDGAVSRPRVSAVRPPLARRMLAAVPPYLYLLPGMISLALWTYKPIIEAVQLSFYRWNLLPTSPRIYVGLENYQRLFTIPQLRDAAMNTLWYVLGLVPFAIILPTAVALVVRDLSGRSRTVYRALLFLPVLVAPVAAAAVWRWLLDPSGLVNHALGLGAFNWLREESTALFSILMICAWQILGFAVLVISAGLTGISADYTEAAEMDGASRWQTTRWVTLPMLRSTLLFMLLMTVLLSAQWTFPLIDVLTQGGPVDSTTNVYYLLWEFGFRSLDSGLASAAGVVFFLAFAVVAAALVKLADHYSFADN